MAKARPPVAPRLPWKSEDELKQAVQRRCEEKFAEIFGRPWEPICKTGLLESHGRYFEQDQNARELWEELRRVLRKIEAFVTQEHLRSLTLKSLTGKAARRGKGEPPRLSPEQLAEDLAGGTARAGALADWFVMHGRSVCTAQEFALDVPSFPAVLRGFVIDAWEFVDPRYLPHQPPPPPAPSSGYKPMATGPDNKTRKLSNTELAVVSLLCGSWPKVRAAALDAGIPVGNVVDRERKNIALARKHRSGPM